MARIRKKFTASLSRRRQLGLPCVKCWSPIPVVFSALHIVSRMRMGIFFPRRSCFTTEPNLRMHIERAKSHLWNFWTRDVARICKREAPQAFGHHPGQSPTIPHIADSTSRRSSLRVECLKTDRMIIMNTQCRHSIRAALTSGKGSMIGMKSNSVDSGPEIVLG